MILYVGDYRFSPDEIREVREEHYQRNKEHFDIGLANKYIVVATEKDIKAEEEKIAEQKEKKERSIIKQYKDGDLHWRSAEKEIKEVRDSKDLDALQVLSDEGFELGLDYSDVVMKRLRDAIQYLEMRAK